MACRWAESSTISTKARSRQPSRHEGRFSPEALSSFRLWQFSRPGERRQLHFLDLLGATGNAPGGDEQILDVSVGLIVVPLQFVGAFAKQFYILQHQSAFALS